MKQRSQQEMFDLREAARFLPTYVRPLKEPELKTPPHTHGCFACSHTGPRLAADKRYMTTWFTALREVNGEIRRRPAMAVLISVDDKGQRPINHQYRFLPSYGRPGSSYPFPRIWNGYTSWGEMTSVEESWYVRGYRRGTDKPEMHVNSRVQLVDMLHPDVAEDPDSWDYHMTVQPLWGAGVYINLIAEPLHASSMTKNLVIAQGREQDFTERFTKQPTGTVLLEKVEALSQKKSIKRPKKKPEWSFVATTQDLGAYVTGDLTSFVESVGNTE